MLRVIGLIVQPLPRASAIVRCAAASWPLAISDADVSPLTRPDSHGFVAGAWDYREETRAALVESFNRRNAESARLPLTGLHEIHTHPDVRTATAGPDLVVELSQPAYTSNGFALMYGQSSRRGQPLQGWAFVLSHASGRWTVQHGYLLWILQ